MNNDPRKIQIIKLLRSRPNGFTIDEIAMSLNVSSRTIRDDLRSIHEIVNAKNECITKLKNKVVIQNEYLDEVDHWIEIISREQNALPTSNPERVRYIVRRLINSVDYIKIDDLSDEMFYNRSTISNDLKSAKTILAKFGLKISTRPNYGIKITGNEINKRMCIVNYCYQDEKDDLKLKGEVKEIQLILYDALQRYKLNVSDFVFQNLCYHIVIAMIRIQEMNHIPPDTMLLLDIESNLEFQCATYIADQLRMKYNIDFPESEINYMTMHLVGKRMLDDVEHSQYIIKPDTFELTDEIIHELKRVYHLDLFDNLEFRVTFSLHLQPLLNRIKFGLQIKNPIKEKIKRTYPLAFEMASYAAQIIGSKYEFTLDEDEISYLALHFNLAMEKKSGSISKKRILAVCVSGRGSSQFIKHQLQSKLSNFIESVETAEYFMLDHIDFSLYDYVFSTVQINKILPIPVIYIKSFFSFDDIGKIEKQLESMELQNFNFLSYLSAQRFFANVEAESKEEVIDFLCDHLIKQNLATNEFQESVLERERISTTEFGNLVAIPHPMIAMSDETYVSVAILSKPILWSKEMVRVVFLIAYQTDHVDSMEIFNRMFARFVMSHSLVLSLIKNPSYTQLLKIMKLVEYYETNDIDMED
ncbi:MAG: transcription antiterminator [Erysipelotrichaceae bacterium]